MDVLQNIGIDIATMVALVAYIVRMEMKQKELIIRRTEDKKELENQVDKLEENIQQQVDKNEVTMFKKFSGVHAKMEKNEDKYNNEFKSLNKEITHLKLAIGVVDGKLDILISK